MKKKRSTARRFINFFSGDFILTRGLDRQVGFAVYIFAWICLLIAWSLTVESDLVKVRQNEKAIESLRIDRDQRAIELLSLDRRSTLEELLKKNHSELTAPQEPAVILKK